MFNVQLAGQEGGFVHCVMFFYLCHAISIPLVGMRGLLFLSSLSQSLPYTVKKGSRVSRLQPGCH
jgi:hypothetical protein